MKKETKRYSIVEYVGKTVRVVKSEKEYNELLSYIKKLNNKSLTVSKYYYGNLSLEKKNGTYEVTIHIYNRLTCPRTISDIDDECSKVRSMKDFLESGYVNGVRHANPDIYISYFETMNKSEQKKNGEKCDVGVKALPFMFDSDQKYFDENYIKKCVIYHAKEKDISFFKNMCEEFCLNHNVTDAIIKLRATINKVQNEGEDPFYLSVDAMRLYKSLVYERNSDKRVPRNEEGEFEISHRRVRDFGSFIRDYQMSRKKLSTRRYNIKQDPKDSGIKPEGEEAKINYR